MIHGTKEVDDTSKVKVHLMEKKVTSLRISASIHVTQKTDIGVKISQLHNQLEKVRQKIIEQHLRKAIATTTEVVEVVVVEGKTFCITYTDAGVPEKFKQTKLLGLLEAT
ncbi:hypothetical protein V6N13_101164 [Hibiscus sabdariffa]|uniref:Uncharacterized protein n=2 Tax=Hibiscus sabdariffa TaxID=183260 RepID=A0ABR1ZIT8_9ROSI